MFRTNLQAAFNVVRETREVPDPYGLGIVFEVYRDDSQQYQRKVNDLRLADPMFARAFNAVGRAQVRAMVEGTEFGQDEMKAAAITEIQNFDVSADFFARMAEQGLRECALRIAGWHGLADENGQPVEHTLEHAVELLRAPEWVPEDQPFGGKTLGEALQECITKAALEHAVERDAYLEGAEKNSERSSAGERTTSPDSTT